MVPSGWWSRSPVSGVVSGVAGVRTSDSAFCIGSIAPGEVRTVCTRWPRVIRLATASTQCGDVQQPRHMEERQAGQPRAEQHD